MSDLSSKLSGLELSSYEISDITDFDPRFIEDYQSMKDDIQAIAAHVEPPAGNPPGLLRDDLTGVGDILTAPTSNQAYILDQKTIANAQLISDHENNIDNPHSTIFTDLDDVDTNSLINLAGFVPFVSSTFKLILRKIFALDIFFDDTNLGTGLPTLQELIELFDDQIGLRETAATGTIDGGGGATVDATNISVNAGNGEIVDGYTDRRNPSRINVSWDAVPLYAISMPSNIGVQVIFTDATGVVQQQSMPLSESQRRSIVQIAFVYYRNGSIISTQHAGIHSNEVGNTLYDLIYRFPFASRTTGMGIRAVTNALSVFADEGTFFSPGISVAVDLTNPNVGQFPAVGDINTPMVFDVIFADGTTVPGLSAQTTIPKFWESAPNVSTALGGNDATIGYLFKTFGNTYLFQLGANLYTNGALARDSLDVDRDLHVSFLGSENTLPSAQIYNDRTSTDFNDVNKAGIVSLIGSGAGSSGSIAVTNWIDLTDVNATTYTGQTNKYSRVNATDNGLDLFDLQIIHDPAPKLGGELRTEGNNIVVESSPGAESGQIGNLISGGVFLAKTTEGAYDPNDGGIIADSGILEMHGAIAQVKTLAGVGNREVWINSGGSMFAVTPPPPGFTVSDTDNGDYPLAGLGVFVVITGLFVTIPQVVAVGEPVQLIVNLHVVNGSSTRGGTIDISFGINGAAPTVNGVNKVIAGGLDNIVPISITSTNHSGLAINDTFEIWVRRSTEEHNQFDPNINGSVGSVHELAVSNSASGGGGAVNSVDGRTGTVTLGDLYLSLLGGILTGPLETQLAIAAQRVFYANSNEPRMQLGIDGGGVSTTWGARRNDSGIGQWYGAYLSYDCWWDEVNRLWTANRTTLSNKWKIEFGNQRDEFVVSKFSGDASVPWIDSAWVDLFTVGSNGNASVSAPLPLLPEDLVRKDFVESLHRIQTRVVTAATTVNLTDERNKIDYNSASAGNITIDPVATTAYPVGFQCLVKQKGAGVFTLVAGAGVTIDAEDNFFTSAKQNTTISLIYDGSDIWTASGNFI